MWKYNDKGIERTKKLEEWVWEVYYQDGTAIKQFDEEGIYHKTSEIEDKPITSVRAVYVYDHSKTIKIEVESYKDIVYFYRNAVFNFGKPNEVRVRAIIFGKEGEYYYLIGGKISKQTSKDLNINDICQN